MKDTTKLKEDLIALENAIEKLMETPVDDSEVYDEVLTNYYMMYARIAKDKIEDPDVLETIVDIGSSLAWMYDSIKTENY